MEHHHDNEKEQIICPNFRKGEYRRFPHKFCPYGNDCLTLDRWCKYLHPSDEVFGITCKKSWKHCPYGRACKFKQHADQDYNDCDNNNNNEERFNNLINNKNISEWKEKEDDNI